MDALKREERAGEISQDFQHETSKEVQTLTDNYIAKVGDLLDTKEKEILQV